MLYQDACAAKAVAAGMIAAANTCDAETGAIAAFLHAEDLERRLADTQDARPESAHSKLRLALTEAREAGVADDLHWRLVESALRDLEMLLPGH